VVSGTPHVNYVAYGLLLPERLAGEPALELCNTFAGWGEAGGREYLETYAHLVVWAREQGLVDAGAATRLRDAQGGERVLERARALRAAFYAVATGAAADADRAVVAQEAERSAAAASLAWLDGAAVWALPETPELPLLATARAVADFLVRPVRVGRCPGHGCGWLFADAGGRRRWCSMAVCGNRAKQRRHAERARGGR
jgi:predicted RNA-binding Zn ribbon-like protein